MATVNEETDVRSVANKIVALDVNDPNSIIAHFSNAAEALELKLEELRDQAKKDKEKIGGYKQEIRGLVETNTEFKKVEKEYCKEIGKNTEIIQSNKRFAWMTISALFLFILCGFTYINVEAAKNIIAPTAVFLGAIPTLLFAIIFR